MFSIKTLASTLAAASLVSVIGLAYAQTGGQPPSDPATTRSSTAPGVQSPSDQGNTTMPNDRTSTQDNTTMPNNSAGSQGTATMPDSSTGTRGSAMPSDNNLRDGSSSDLEPRADRN